MDSREDLVVDDRLVIPAAELTWRFTPAGGPGGQHANVSRTRAEVVFDVETSAVLSDDQRRRLLASVGPRLAVSADDTRSQARNRQLALERLRARLRDGLRREKPRRPTRPGRSATERRLRDKRRRSERKAARRRRHDEE